VYAHEIDREGMVRALHEQLQTTKSHATLGIADDLTIPVDVYRKHLQKQVENSREPEPLAFAAAFGCDAVRDRNGNIVDTALRTMSGAGHQHFLKTMREVLKESTTEHISRTLFAPWNYDDPLQGFSLRFDPLDDKRYALRWRNPSGDPSRADRGNMLAANALAVLGLPLCVTAPVQGSLETTGFHGRHSTDCFWTWPIWDGPLPLDIVASLVALEELQKNEPPRASLAGRGVVEIFRSQRVTAGKFRNFTPAQPV
jgi:hypothetical protein